MLGPLFQDETELRELTELWPFESAISVRNPVFGTQRLPGSESETGALTTSALRRLIAMPHFSRAVALLWRVLCAFCRAKFRF